MSSVYEPREDSMLLADCVQRLARGRTLDMGTGSGVLAFAALESPHATAVVAVDVNPLAVARVQARIDAHEHPRAASLRVVRSDRFSALAGQEFDTIVCNPPYLPDEEHDHDPALYGGPNGHEWTVAFLQEAGAHLAKDGQILLLFSSLTGRERVDLALNTLGFTHLLLAERNEFFEKLYVYLIRRKR
jgi:release factor glutamine methyltransferase